MSEEQEIKKTILQSTENLEAAYLVFKSFEETKAQLLDKLKNDLFKNIQHSLYKIQEGSEGFF